MAPSFQILNILNTWNRIRIALIIQVLASFASLILSGIQYRNHQASDVTTTENWNDLCNNPPIKYVKPFSFAISYDGNTSGLSYCGWPESNSIFRFVIASVTIISLITLYFNTPVSQGAILIHFSCLVLWYSAFVVDVNSLYIGEGVCNNDFKGLFVVYSGDSVTDCSSSNYYGVTIAIDLVIAMIFLFIWRSWTHCSNLYGMDSSTTNEVKQSSSNARNTDNVGISWGSTINNEA